MYNSLGINTPATDIRVGCHSSLLELPDILIQHRVCTHTIQGRYWIYFPAR
jgi:hypothetical protein